MLALIKQRPGALPSLAILLGVQGLVTVINSAMQQLLVARMMEMVGRAAATVTGIAFGVAGLTNSVSAIGYTTITRWIGYVNALTIASMLLAIAVAVLVVAPNTVVVVIAVGATGLLYGAVVPGTASMIVLESTIVENSALFAFDHGAVTFSV